MLLTTNTGRISWLASQRLITVKALGPRDP
ncbi:hypothetical protein HMPREF0975_00439 [Actinomyces sp. oral taxon 849 str. F0330]|nr:hypothetical protein HMPREF0975_00439 [Actinomyces sp. oral taxon 849 str. F0330]